jgi:manganese/zinc/iron transport system permease protein
MNAPLFLIQDFPMLAAGLLASIACALIGSFLVLRKMSLMGDAISHAVLPGIVAAFLFAGSLQAMPVFIGAAIVGVLTALLSELIHRWGRVETGAAMGVVFTILFAIGIIMLQQTRSDTVHLDADCVLYGAMENVLWTTAPAQWDDLFTVATWGEFPRPVATLGIVVVVNILFIMALFKELRISTFDPGLSSAQGINPHIMHYLLMTLVAITIIAAFEAVGSILVVAMLIVPGLIAHMFCNRLGWLLVFASLVAVVASLGGYGAAVTLNTNAAGMIGVMLGVLLLVAGIAVKLLHARVQQTDFIPTQQ